MKQNLNVIDLDRTLLPYDSFRKYIFLFLKNNDVLIYIVFFLFLRKLRMINSSVFKKKIIKKVRKTKDYDLKIKKFTQQLYDDINSQIMSLITEHSDERTKIVLCTASIDDYVKYLSNLLGWEYVCSELDLRGDNFVHMYGEKKFSTINTLYPAKKYFYNFAISDSKSDKVLLEKFKSNILVKKNV